MPGEKPQLLSECLKPLERAQVILDMLEEEFDAQLVVFEITESEASIEVLIPPQSVREAMT